MVVFQLHETKDTLLLMAEEELRGHFLLLVRKTQSH